MNSEAISVATQSVKEKTAPHPGLRAVTTSFLHMI